MTDWLEHAKAEALRCTLEGRPFAFSLELTDEALNLCNWPIERNAEPQPELVASILRSNIPLTPPIRHVLAEFVGRKPTRGRKKADFRLDEALYVEELCDGGEKYEYAIEMCMKEFGISRTTATDAYGELKKIRQINAQTYRE